MSVPAYDPSAEDKVGSIARQGASVALGVGLAVASAFIPGAHLVVRIGGGAFGYGNTPKEKFKVHELDKPVALAEVDLQAAGGAPLLLSPVLLGGGAAAQWPPSFASELFKVEYSVRLELDERLLFAATAGLVQHEAMAKARTSAWLSFLDSGRAYRGVSLAVFVSNNARAVEMARSGAVNAAVAEVAERKAAAEKAALSLKEAESLFRTEDMERGLATIEGASYLFSPQDATANAAAAAGNAK